MTEKLKTWYRIEQDGSGDYYFVPEGLFKWPDGTPMCLEEAVWELDNFEELLINNCIGIGGFASDVLIRGEFKRK